MGKRPEPQSNVFITDAGIALGVRVHFDFSRQAAWPGAP
jgi:hypothetical protein